VESRLAGTEPNIMPGGGGVNLPPPTCDIRYEKHTCNRRVKQVCEICPKLLLMSNRKLQMRFQLASRLITLDDLEVLQVRNYRNVAQFFA